MAQLYSLGMDFLNIAFDNAFENIYFFFLSYIVVLFIFKYKKKDFLTTAFVSPAIFALFTIFNAYLMLPICKIIGLTSRVRRLFWLLPINLVLAYALTRLIQKQPKKNYRIAYFLLAAALIIFCGKSMFSYMTPAENIYKISNESIEIAEFLSADKGENVEKNCLYTDLNLLELRQYDASIKNYIRRTDLLKWNINASDSSVIEEIISENNSRHLLQLPLRYGIAIDPERFQAIIKKKQIEYIILTNSMGMDSFMLEMEYSPVLVTENYTVYRTTK